MLLKDSYFVYVVIISLRDTSDPCALHLSLLFPPTVCPIGMWRSPEQEMIRMSSLMLAHKLALCFLMPGPSGSCRLRGLWSQILVSDGPVDHPPGLRGQACSDSWLVLTPLCLLASPLPTADHRAQAKLARGHICLLPADWC